MSPIEPAGSASTKKGSEDAVWVSATYIGPAPKDTINQAAPTLCMKVPMSESTSAMRRLRNVATRSGDHGLRGIGFRPSASEAIDVDDGIGKRLGSFLRQIVSDGATQ